jgi:predicted Zn-dependent peptidase
MLNLLYQKDSVRIEVAGTVDSIAKITPDYLYRCYGTFYQLSNMALVVCGDVDYSKVIEIADELLAVDSEKKIERYFEAEPKGIAKKRSKREMSVARPQFAIAFKDTPPPDPAEGVRRAVIMSFLLTHL